MSTPLKRLSLMAPLLTLCVALIAIAPRTGAAQEGNASGSAPKAAGDTQADKDTAAKDTADKDKADKDKAARKSDKKKDAAKAADKAKAADEAAPLTDDELDQQILEQLKALGYTE